MSTIKNLYPAGFRALHHLKRLERAMREYMLRMRHNAVCHVYSPFTYTSGAMVGRRISLLILAVFFITSPLHAAERLDLEAVLDEMDAASAGFETIQADVTYTRTIFLLDEEEVAEGTLRYKKPRKLRLEFNPPKNEKDISDGKFFWVYKPNEKQVEKYKLAEGDTTELSFFEFGYEGSVEKARKNYFIEMISGGEAGETEGEKEGQYVLKLTPKSSDGQAPQYNEIKLWVDDSIWLPVRMELYESDGEVINRIELWEVEVNTPLDDDIFRFEVPEGVEIIEPL